MRAREKDLEKDVHSKAGAASQWEGEHDCNRNSFAFLSFKSTTLQIQGSLCLQFSGLLQDGKLQAKQFPALVVASAAQY